MTAYVLAIDGMLYRAVCDFKETKNVNISDKKVSIEGVSYVQSMLLIGRKLYVSAGKEGGKVHLLRN